ncbi:hypothetical protein [Hydrogenobacter hydrogenophilus]|uniref:hypothetical protein n=1 Tax=Hydrogenobacter hydrogenophilus TaxID=35835 RepID=UPI00117A7B94|nr:hypothetical protein [Hydrogenobacter hydrogenophilus]
MKIENLKAEAETETVAVAVADAETEKAEAEKDNKDRKDRLFHYLSFYFQLAELEPEPWEERHRFCGSSQRADREKRTKQ